ncbi:type I restriction enzyme, S subunit [Acinetobacter marinus]|uniref:Type I restriction enzyme, S subunit n=1 Tax=Acinetobacter marinus TaxID=281375 RepID=A0A1G6PA68_9GAMM|nr:restriction endonuclease subunit S [Acinetobacter marinus]SDC76317.1 type I restriction enzyme, S subunit [Acinetobacter marinus]
MATYTEFVYSDYFKTELPSHWQEKRLGFLAEQTKNAFVDGPFGSDLKSDDYLDEGVPLIQLNNIRDGKHILRNMKFISDHKKLDLIRHLALPKDIVIAKMAEPVARATIVSDEYDEYVIVADCVKLTPNLNLVDLEFLVWAINSDCVRENAELVSTGTTRIRINLGELKKLKVPYPSLTEQIKIREYLDHETAQIDSLITKQEKLIELLKEKRQAVISHAVTKGLNPNVPMKDSGVEWLGEVPEHWISARLKYYTNQIVDGAHFTPTYSESGVPFLRVTDIHNEEIDMEDIKYIPENEHRDLVQRCKPEKGDLLLSKNGTIGVPKLINWDWEFSIFVSLCLIKFKKNLKAEFAEYFFKSYEIQEQIFGLIKKSTVINLHLDKIQNFWFSIPPIEEQLAIVNYLDDKIQELNKLIEKAELAIKFMQERRTALISAAVTGKIDVRHWQQPNQKNNNKELSA